MFKITLDIFSRTSNESSASSVTSSRRRSSTVSSTISRLSRGSLCVEEIQTEDEPLTLVFQSSSLISESLEDKKIEVLVSKPVTKEEAHKVFYALGDRFWMQIIDGKYHKHGKMVFDEGLDLRDKKPGFFASLEKACQFASEHLTEPLTIDFYKKLFSYLNKDDGAFRNKSVKYPISEEYLFEDIHKVREVIKNKESRRASFVDQEYSSAKKKMEEMEKSCAERVDAVNAQIMNRCEELGIKEPFPQMVKEKELFFYKLEMICRCHSPLDLETNVQLLIDDYNKKMNPINKRLKEWPREAEKITLMEKKVEIIADFFQLLNRLHPFLNQQSTTDLVLMAKLLSEEGLTPALLEESYTSCWSLPLEWKQYLQEGMKAWVAERDRQ